ncbi:hypothetical protein PB70LOC_01986 [Pectobacterium versatile]|uniref:hypothetical protein n=1 Tax=Pectobacterium TaxID=122277 RepID=UPI000D4680EE|nr:MULTISPECIES: hypothetical protein [Pectobacterium]KAA3666269.1 hypothetical protein FEV48_17835 [Pectobacterium carotovorum subsp. carotovorum]POY58634.1 hypothetical protein PB70LOC_01986 [Pectobacterium versatile]POY62383.1 hypothetical protein PB69LOC_03175 [Pectobacterium versatile]
MSNDAEKIFTNSTINQHYLSRAEQRLNSQNKNAQPRNQEINIFDIEDIKALGFSATSVTKKIAVSLMGQDLFSIRTGKNKRLNLENLMTPLESGFSDAVDDFISNNAFKEKSSKENTESLKKILSLKYMSTFRNPYYIERTLRILNFGTNFILDSDEHLTALINLYRKDNNIKRLSETFKVSEQTYISWINTLIALLLNSEKNKSIIEGMVNEILMANEFIHFITLYTYDNDVVFLPEAGMYETADYHSINYFINLSSRAFLLINSNAVSNLGRMKIAPTLYKFMVEKSKGKTDIKEFIDKVKGSKYFDTEHNNYGMLRLFNTQCVIHAKKHVLFAQSHINEEIYMILPNKPQDAGLV